MSQPRTLSAIEAACNVTVGFLAALVTQLAVFPVFGLSATAPAHLGISAILTVVSLVRSYLLRRVFARLGG